MKFFTIGYGGRVPDEFASLLVLHGIRSVADVRIRPDRASMGAYVKGARPTRGSKDCSRSGASPITPSSSSETCSATWTTGVPPYRVLFERAGDLLVSRLGELPEPFCLLCAEKRVAECHRLVIADFLVATKGWSVEHIE